jgi:hypothetical protein
LSSNASATRKSIFEGFVELEPEKSLQHRVRTTQATCALIDHEWTSAVRATFANYPHPDAGAAHAKTIFAVVARLRHRVHLFQTHTTHVLRAGMASEVTNRSNYDNVVVILFSQ